MKNRTLQLRRALGAALFILLLSVVGVMNALAKNFTVGDLNYSLNDDGISVTAVANPIEGDIVMGGGTFDYGQTCTLVATPNKGYSFRSWTENDVVVSYNPTYTFTVMGNRNLVANFGNFPEVVIGYGGTETNQYLPSYSYYNYTLSQQIYTADEIGTSGLITSVAFYNGGSTKTRVYDIYMVNTNKTSFEGVNDWISVTEEDLVYSGSVTMNASVWTTIVLDTPFDYNINSNLAIIVDDNTGSYTNSPHMACRVFDADGNQALRIYSDGTNYNPYNPTQYNGTLHSVKNQITLGFLDPDTPTYLITASANPEEGGTVLGGSAYYSGQSCTLTATANDGYIFLNWTKNDLVVSTNSTYRFAVTEDAEYVANFMMNPFGLVSAEHYPNPNDPNSPYVKVSWSEQIQRNITNYDFEDGIPSDWSLIDADGDGYNWNAVVGNSGVHGHNNSNGLVTSESWNYDIGVLFPDNYLVSPQITLGGIFSFWACAQDANWAAEHFGVAVSTTSNTDALAFTTIQEWTMTARGIGAQTSVTRSGNRDQSVWYQYTVDLSEYAGQTGYVAIRHFNCTDMFRLNVDDVEYISSPSPTYQVYRAYCDGSNATMIADDIIENEYIDNDWSAMAGGNYKYGVKLTYPSNTELYWSNCIEKSAGNACNIVFNLYDSYGDGWNNNYLVVEYGGWISEQLTFTSGSQATYVLEIEDESHVALSWISGSWTSECSFSVSYEEGELIYQTSSPSEGTLYEFDCDCFDANTFYIASTADPEEGGMAMGSGRYGIGDTCILTASPSEGFLFINWTKNDSIVSTDATYSFTVTESGNYVAHFARLFPELHVTGITHSAMSGGQQATISWTVQNDGTAATPNGATWNDYVWLSVESCVNTNFGNLVLLGSFENISALNVGESYTQTQTFNIPIDISGDYYLFVLTDVYDAWLINWENNTVPNPYNPPPYISCYSRNNGVINELSEYEHGYDSLGYYNDNFFYELVDIAVPLVPDLQVTSILTPNNFFSGTDVNVTATITNVGEVGTPNANWTDVLCFSMEPDFNSAYYLSALTHSGALQVDSSYQVTFSCYIPLTLYGEWYFFVKTDYYDQVYEHVLNQNNVTMSNAVNIILTPPADLEPLDLVVPVAASTAENFSYSFKVNNIGAGNPNVSSWKDKVYLCQNSDTLDATAVLLKTNYHYGGLEPGMSYTINESVALPSSVSSGFYYLYVVTDTDDNVFEYLFENNNLAQSSVISITSPDLQITQVTAPEQITSGYPINLTYTITNYGDGAIMNRSITDKVYISQTESLSGAVRIASLSHNVNLPVGQSVTFTCNQSAPTDLTDGTFHLIVVTDAYNEIHESNEGNNMASQYPMPVMHQPLPDLQPISLVLPNVIQAGDAVTVEFDISNNGDLDLLNSNCTFNIYAVWNNHEVLCPLQSQTLPLGSNVSIGIGQTVHFVRSIFVPASVPSTCTSFILYVDKDNQVTESNEDNNTITTNATVLECPLPDLTISNISLPVIQAGAEVQVSFMVNNVGTVDFNGSFSTAIYAIVNGNQILCPLRQQIAPATNESYNLPVGSSLTFTQKVHVPPTVTSTCNIFKVKVDRNNTVLESNEDNNSANVSATVQDYPFNLTTQSLNVATTVTAGEITSISWTVKNTGTCPSEQIPFYMKNWNGYTLVEGEYLSTPWKDRIYLSNDAVLDNNDTQLLYVNHNMVLNPNSTYSVEQTITLPYSAVGSRYLLCVSDADQLTFDNNRTDNVIAVPVTVELGVLPDLRITSLTVDEVMTCDRAYWLHYTVINEGERVTQKNNWTDTFFIGESMTYIGALEVGTKIHHGALEVGESYTDSIEILIPNGLDGEYFLIGFTDRTNQIYENNNEDDNVLATSVTVLASDPCDLIALQPEFPATVVSGEEMTISWQLHNIGLNPAIGRIRNAVYLSTDTEWSSDDKMLGYGNIDINLAANAQQTCLLSGMLTSVPEGHYYVIVKANILNALNESSYENNICVSMLTTEVGYPTLAIGEQVDRTLATDQYIYYKLEVGPEYEGQTLSCTLTTAEQQVANGLYLSHETVPTLSQYDYGKYAPYAQEIEILIPALEQGDYYLLAKGSTQNGSPQQVSIATSIINFEILHIDADHGANTGSITTKVTGAKFDSIMDFRLVQGGEYLPAEKVFFSNSTETYTTFDLVDMPAGTYAMEAELPGGIITIKGEAFTIEEGLPAELAVNIVAPSSVRRGNTFPVNIEYGNIGTTDLNVSGFVVVSRNGHPIGFTSDELAEGLTERVFSTAEANGNPDVLRPGYRATKTILVDANTLTSVSLQVYAIRKQY